MNRTTDIKKLYATHSQHLYFTSLRIVGNSFEAEEIKKALLLLPDNYRTILSLHLFEGYDYQEIEQITGTKEATLRSLYKRAKEKLAATLQNR